MAGSSLWASRRTSRSMSLLPTWEAPHDRTASNPSPRTVAPGPPALGHAGRLRSRVDRDGVHRFAGRAGRAGAWLQLRVHRHRRIRLRPADAVLLALRRGRGGRASLLPLAAELRRTRPDLGDVAG